jgi:hypothetical protein
MTSGLRLERDENYALLAITKRVVLISHRRLLGFLTPDDGTDRLSRNVGNKLPLLAT